MTLWKSDRVTAGTREHFAAKLAAQQVKEDHRLNGRSARVEWRDEYNDYSVAGVFAVVA